MESSNKLLDWGNGSCIRSKILPANTECLPFSCFYHQELFGFTNLSSWPPIWQDQNKDGSPCPFKTIPMPVRGIYILC